jgi:hypothetical protein
LTFITVLRYFWFFNRLRPFWFRIILNYWLYDLIITVIRLSLIRPVILSLFGSWRFLKVLLAWALRGLFTILRHNILALCLRLLYCLTLLFYSFDFGNCLLYFSLFRLLYYLPFGWFVLKRYRLLWSCSFFWLKIVFFIIFEYRSFICEPRIVWLLVINGGLYCIFIVCSHEIVFWYFVLLNELELILFYWVIVLHFIPFPTISDSLLQLLCPRNNLFGCNFLSLWSHRFLDLKLFHNLKLMSWLLFLIEQTCWTLSGKLVDGWFS